MSPTYADSHDLDKLGRWYDALSCEEGNRFPIHAVFLVSDGDTVSHDIFRRFRASFEARRAPFHQLAIFGQHGISTTVKELMPGFGLEIGSIPVLVLWEDTSHAMIRALPLKKGAEPSDQGPWMDLLSKVEAAADGSGVPLDLSSFPGLTAHQLSHSSVVDLVEGVLTALRAGP